MKLTLLARARVSRWQVDALAALAEQQHSEVMRKHALVVSSSHMDVHALAAIFSTYLAAWKGDKLWADPQREGKGLRHGEKIWNARRDEWQPVRFAEQPDAAASAEQAVERLEKMSVVRQSIVRQLHNVLALYTDVAGREAVGRADGNGRADDWQGTVLVSGEHERLELFSVYMLQQSLSCLATQTGEAHAPTMFGVQETKHQLMLHGLVKWCVCALPPPIRQHTSGGTRPIPCYARLALLAFCLLTRRPVARNRAPQADTQDSIGNILNLSSAPPWIEDHTGDVSGVYADTVPIVMIWVTTQRRKPCTTLIRAGLSPRVFEPLCVDRCARWRRMSSSSICSSRA